MKLLFSILLALCWLPGPAQAADELASGTTADGMSVPYVLTAGSKPAYAVILMPGGAGIMSPRLNPNGRVAFGMGGNFLIRSRALFGSGPFVAASTDATSTPGRILAITADLQRRYGPLKVYVVGTSRSTEATMKLAEPLDGRVAGFVHTSPMNSISSFDPRRFRSRHLIVVHRLDACRVTRPSNGEASHRSYGTELIVMDGGKSTGEDCEAFAYHGYNGIEAETVEKIKAWIAR
ncbi:hypothetical protein BH10PSE6_BH10PSE6_55410 [soil metagenome]